ncbi:MAG TPA: type IV toxin-antitoxin system AbiEi family antitoxin domain-containing protein [Acidimicrobiia bacterium]|nr:type IV toxin-antitoxin system AbiEi family antitoxin domain-containing protein [Acidimicrobiia bacterium]
MISGVEIRVYQIAGTQAGYVTRRQALACGMSPDAIDRRVESRRWIRAKPGLYMIPGFVPTLKGRLMAATVTLGAVVSHESAAELHNLPGVQRGMAVVTVPTRKTNRFPEVVVHQSTDLTSAQVIEKDGLAVTSVVRTTIDLASKRKPRVIGKIVDYLVVRGEASIDEFVQAVGALARHGKPGMQTMHKVLEVRAGEGFMGESELEMHGLRLLREWGFPDPNPQYPLPWRSPRKGRVDFAYPSIRLIIEIDGRRWHSTLDAFEEDRLRDNHAQLAGWRVLRITYRMLMDEPEMVRAMVAQALAVAS